ncbi:hypothetical protein [Kitasatospora sp. MBT63]|uniref:hypothetical protein n=1 Tax=Kitasatospora sp. MBT63 TaxID=1444768 RepID=UPI00068AB319|nr:hypothetical protein [Kitasatospora sp. MBT63]
MRRTCTAAAALLGATAMVVLAGPTAHAKDVAPAWVSPAEGAPGQTVTVSVTCDTSSVKTVTANSQAFTGGSATLTVGPDGKYSGPAKLVAQQDLVGTVKKALQGNSWGIDGKCPNGDTFTGAVSVTGSATWGTGAGQESSHPATAQEGSHPAVRPDGPAAPHGAVGTGLGGSIDTDGRQLAAGGVLVAAGIAGFWLLRRRPADGPQS